ncbi:MAG TPA: PIN domain-containing protein [Nakamurella sp.]
MTRFLVDNSVLARISRPQVYQVLSDLAAQGHELSSSMVSLAEAGYSARTTDDYDNLVDRLRYGWLYLESGPMVDAIALDLRRSLHIAGSHRAVGAVDVLLAATALAHHAAVLHYDADFDKITAAHPGFLARWAVPKGSID